MTRHGRRRDAEARYQRVAWEYQALRAAEVRNPYRVLAKVHGITEPNARVLVSRARRAGYLDAEREG